MKNIINLINEEIRKIIKERPFDSFDNDEILSDKNINDAIKREIKNDTHMHNVWDYMKNILNIHTPNMEDFDKYKNSKEFKVYFKNLIKNKLIKSKENILNSIDSKGELTLFRAISVSQQWIDHLKSEGKRLGIYWSWEETGAVPYMIDRNKRNIAIIVIKINEKYVDWNETFKLNMDFMYGHENEIRLFKNTPLNIVSIRIDDKEIDLSQLRGKQFYA